MRRTMGSLVLGAAMLLASQAFGQAVIRVLDVAAAPGTDVAVDVILTTSQGEEVAGTQNDITFDPADGANLAALNRCVIDPVISDDAANCEDDPNSGPCKQLNRALDDVEGGRRFRGLILSLSNTTIIPDGVLYTCTFTVASDAAIETVIPLACSNQGASDPAGGAITTLCVGGSITVRLPPESPTPSMTPTTAVTITPTSPPTTPTIAGPTRTNTRPTDTSDDDDGCQVVAPASSHMTWLLFAPAVLLLWSRRRSR
jgi:hypothetical protein